MGPNKSPPRLPVYAFPVRPGTMECVAKQKADIEQMQRECWCGGRLQCEHEERKVVDMAIAYAPVQEKEQEENQIQ